MMLQQRRSPNGQALSRSYLLTFDEDNDVEEKARKVAQELAAERKLKQFFIGVLLSIHTIQERTGKKLDLTEFTASFITGLVVGGNTHTPFEGLDLSADMSEQDLPTPFIGTADHVDPAAARQAFSAGMGDLFADDDDEWED